MMPARFILASSSPRRRELLTQIGLRFSIEPANIDEVRRTHESPKEYVLRLALEKARAVHALNPAAAVLGADTTVVVDGEMLNKPVNFADARRMLLALSDRQHFVHTGIAVVAGVAQRTHLETTTVFFSAIPEADLAYYLSTGDSLDKAGAYGIQGYAARWIPRIEGDFFNVVGLPLAATIRLLAGA